MKKTSGWLLLTSKFYSGSDSMFCYDKVRMLQKGFSQLFFACSVKWWVSLKSLVGLIIYQTLQVFYFSQFFDYLKENEYRVVFRILHLHSHWFGIIQWITRHKFATVKACWISCAFFQFVLRNTGKMSCDKGFKASYELTVCSCHVTYAFQRLEPRTT